MNQLVHTKLGHKFFKLIDKHFPKSNSLSKIFSGDTLKLSYSCTNNLEKIIKSHNTKLLIYITNNRNISADLNVSLINNQCNCKNLSQYLLSNMCLTKSLVYDVLLSQLKIPGFLNISMPGVQ